MTVFRARNPSFWRAKFLFSSLCKETEWVRSVGGVSSFLRYGKKGRRYARFKQTAGEDGHPSKATEFGCPMRRLVVTINFT